MSISIRGGTIEELEGPLPCAFFLMAMVFVWFFPISRSRQKELAKIAAQARLDRTIAQAETSSVGSTHSPRDVKELADFINDINEQSADPTKVMEAMSSQLCEMKYQEYCLSGPRTLRVSFNEETTNEEAVVDEAVPRPPKKLGSESDKVSAQSYGLTAATRSTESGTLNASHSQPTGSQSLTYSSASASSKTASSPRHSVIVAI